MLCIMQRVYLPPVNNCTNTSMKISQIKFFWRVSLLCLTLLCGPGLNDLHAQQLPKVNYLIPGLTADSIKPYDRPLLDSVLGVYAKTTSDTARLNLLMMLSENLSEPSLWLRYNAMVFNAATKWLEKPSDQKGLRMFYLNKKGYALNNFGYYHQNITRNDSVAADYFVNAETCFQQTDNSDGLSIIYNNLTLCYTKAAQFGEALEYYKKAIAHAVRSNQKSVQVRLYCSMGNLQVKYRDSKGAEISYRKAVEIAESLPASQKEDKALAYLGIGDFYKSVSDQMEAKKWYLKTIAAGRQSPHYRPVCRACREIGDTYSKQGLYDSAWVYLNIADKLARMNKDSMMMILNAEAILWLNYRQKNYQPIIAFEKQGLTWINTSSGLVKASIIEVVSRAYEAAGDYKKALFYRDAFLRHKVMDFADEKRSAALGFKAEFEYARKLAVDEEKRRQEATVQAYERRTRYIIFGAGGIVLLLLALLAFNLRQRYVKSKATNAKIQLQNEALESERRRVTEKSQIIEQINGQLLAAMETTDQLKTAYTIFMQEQQLQRNQLNPHFIYNCLNSVQSMVLSKRTEAAYEYVSKFSKLLRQILNQSNAVLNYLHQELDNLKLYIELEQVRCNNGFDYSITLTDKEATEEVKIPILLIQPYVENAIWHGIMHLPAGERGRIDVHVTIREGKLHIQVADTGIGIAAHQQISKPKHVSHGLAINVKRMESINFLMKEDKASVTIHDNTPRGTLVDIEIPLLYSYGE